MTDPINLEIEQANQISVCPEPAEAGAPASDNISTGCNSDSTKDEDDDWNNPDYRTAEFRMYCFKVLPCTKEHPHRWTNCPFAHGGEHACRRDPRKYDYSAVVCPDLLQTGSCPRGDACNSAHSVFEFWLHPQRYRTQICREGPGCQRRVCFFAHSEDELREVQLPPVEDGVNPFAMAKLAKYSMSSIPEKSRKLARSVSASKSQQQQQASSTSPSKQSSSNSGSPKSSSKVATAADQFAAAVSAAAPVGNDLPQHSRTPVDTTALRRSRSTSTAQQRPDAGLQPGGTTAGGPERSRGRLSMDAACWMNRQQASPAAAAVFAHSADMRTRRRYSLESAVQRCAAAAAATAQGPWNATYLCSNTAPLPGCISSGSYASINGPTVHMALPPRAAVQSLPLAHLGGMRPAACGAVPTAAACSSSSSPSQWMLQQALRQQQQYTACLTDVSSSSLSNQTLDYSSASTLSGGSTDLSGASGSLQQYAMEGIYSSNISEQNGSSKQLPQLMIIRQDSVQDGPLQLVTPDAVSLNSAGPHAANGNAPRPRAQGAYVPMQQQQQGGAAAWYTAAVLPAVQQTLDPPAAARGPPSSPFMGTMYQDQPANPNVMLQSTSMGGNVVLPGYSPGDAAAAAAAVAAGSGGGIEGANPMELWNSAAVATGGSGWDDGTHPNLGLSGSGLQATGLPSLDDLAVQVQQLQMEGAAPADVEKVLLTYQAAAAACRERAQQAQAAADAANERLLACIAALTGSAASTATTAAAAAALLSNSNQQQQLAHQRSGSCSIPSMGSIGSGGVAALPSPHAVAPGGSAAANWSPRRLQQQLLPSERLIMLLDEQGGQVALQAQQQQSQQELPGAQLGYVPTTCTWL